jgi:flagellar export protein FliJ
VKHRDTLLRLKRFRTDELKRRLASLDEMKADLERKLADLNDTVTREKQRASDSDIGRLAFPSFLKSIDERRRNLRATMKELERERASAQEALSEAFRDLKSFELAEEERLRRQTEAESRAAQSRLDEMALARHLRKHALRQL